MSGLDAERLFEQADRNLVIALVPLDLSQEVHLVVGGRVEANQLRKLNRRFVRSTARKEQSRQVASALEVTRLESISSGVNVSFNPSAVPLSRNVPTLVTV